MTQIYCNIVTTFACHSSLPRLGENLLNTTTWEQRSLSLKRSEGLVPVQYCKFGENLPGQRQFGNEDCAEKVCSVFMWDHLSSNLNTGFFISFHK